MSITSSSGHTPASGHDHGNAHTRDQVRGPLVAKTALDAKTRFGHGESEAKPRQILVVDDNQDSAEAMAMMLEYLGYRVSVAFSGQASLDELERHQVDVVLLDLGLPDMHGTAVAERMRSRGYAGKVIAFSGNSEVAMKERCARAGMDHFVVKPCSMESLRTLL